MSEEKRVYLDWNKVETVDDIKRAMLAVGMEFHWPEGHENTEGIKDLLKDS